MSAPVTPQARKHPTQAPGAPARKNLTMPKRLGASKYVMTAAVEEDDDGMDVAGSEDEDGEEVEDSDEEEDDNEDGEELGSEDEEDEADAARRQAEFHRQEEAKAKKREAQRAYRENKKLKERAAASGAASVSGPKSAAGKAAASVSKAKAKIEDDATKKRAPAKTAAEAMAALKAAEATTTAGIAAAVNAIPQTTNTAATPVDAVEAAGRYKGDWLSNLAASGTYGDGTSSAGGSNVGKEYLKRLTAEKGAANVPWVYDEVNDRFRSKDIHCNCEGFPPDLTLAEVFKMPDNPANDKKNAGKIMVGCPIRNKVGNIKGCSLYGQEVAYRSLVNAQPTMAQQLRRAAGMFANAKAPTEDELKTHGGQYVRINQLRIELNTIAKALDPAGAVSARK